MAVLAYPGGPPERRSPVTLGRVLAIGGLALVGLVVWNLLGAQLVTKRPNDMKTTTVILPPPLVTPPPPPEVKPEERPPEPTDAPMIDQPVDQPAPDKPAEASEASSEAAPGDNALTAREGAAPGNYGLAAGDGSGTRIGGRPGGGSNAFAAYAGLVRTAVQVATQADRELARGRYATVLGIVVDPATSRITDVRVIETSGDSRRDSRLRKLLVGLLLSRAPPPGLQMMRLELTSRPGA